MNLRQLCNIAFAAAMENRDAEQREEFIFELSMPLDPMAQAKYVMGGG